MHFRNKFRSISGAGIGQNWSKSVRCISVFKVEDFTLAVLFTLFGTFEQVIDIVVIFLGHLSNK